MQIQKGLVKYKDRSDIVCTYGLTDEGKQYYFLDNNPLSNGNVIASTVLVEAIDPVVVASSIGVINANGEEVIPFENKSIKPVVDGLLLVEVSSSTTPSVVEANSLKSDPLAATKLVTTSATIKDKINAKIGAEGRFIFNDQFSEATICDYDGNNILDGQYFSFIAIKNNETLYMSKNVIDSLVVEYSLSNRKFVQQATDETLEAKGVDVEQSVNDEVMASADSTLSNDITEKNFEAGEIDTRKEELASDEEENAINPEVVISDNVNNSLSSTMVDVNNYENVEEKQLEQDDLPDEPMPVVPDIDISADVLLDDKKEVDSFDEAFNNVMNQMTEDNELEKVMDESDSLSDNNSELFQSFDISSEIENETAGEDVFADSTLHADKIEVDNVFNDFEPEFPGVKDSIMDDVATTMTDLIKQNKEQKQLIASYEERISQNTAAYKKAIEKAKAQLKDVDDIRNKLKNSEAIVSKLDAEIEILQNKIHEQDKLIASQTSELESLKHQLDGRDELMKILADAQSVLER